jgi:hypothetical protein
MQTNQTTDLPVYARTPITLGDAPHAALQALAGHVGVTPEQMLDHLVASTVRVDLSRNEVLAAGLNYCRGKRCRCRKST